MSSVICPYKKYVEVRTGGAVEVLPLLTAPLSASVANNQTVISGVPGKVIRVMGWNVTAVTAGASAQTFKDNNGTIKLLLVQPAGGSNIMPICDGGYFELTTSNPLTVDVNTTGALINIFYVTYTP